MRMSFEFYLYLKYRNVDVFKGCLPDDWLNYIHDIKEINYISQYADVSHKIWRALKC